MTLIERLRDICRRIASDEDSNDIWDAADVLEQQHRALEEIAHPIQAVQKRAREEGNQVDGAVAVWLSNSPNYLKDIAERVIEATKEKLS